MNKILFAEMPKRRQWESDKMPEAEWAPEAGEGDDYTTVGDFVMLVKRMRAKQREYFKTRDRRVMAESMKLEREVDERIKQLGL